MVDVDAKKIEFSAKFKNLVNNPSIDAVVKLQQNITEDGIAALESIVTGNGNIEETANMLAFTDTANRTLAGWANIHFSAAEYKEIYTRMQR